MVDAAATTLPRELSESWPLRLAGQIPPFVDVFCMVGVDPKTDRYVGWGYYESTSEMPGWGVRCAGNVLVLASVRVPLSARSEEGLKFALKQACDMLSRTVWKSPASEYVKFRNKLAADLAFYQAENDAGRPLVSIERADGRTFSELLQSAERAG